MSLESDDGAIGCFRCARNSPWVSAVGLRTLPGRRMVPA